MSPCVEFFALHAVCVNYKLEYYVFAWTLGANKAVLASLES